MELQRSNERSNWGGEQRIEMMNSMPFFARCCRSTLRYEDMGDQGREYCYSFATVFREKGKLLPSAAIGTLFLYGYKTLRFFFFFP
jgi:hypothetical protein